jgi:hypothetical protein
VGSLRSGHDLKPPEAVAQRYAPPRKVGRNRGKTLIEVHSDGWLPIGPGDDAGQAAVPAGLKVGQFVVYSQWASKWLL